MLKYAGWDAVVITGRADRPVWVDIRNRKVEIRDASGLWGKDTWTTQLEIWDLVGGGRGAKRRWKDLNANVDEAMAAETDQGRTTQKPAVLAIGPAGENLTSAGCLMHDAGNGAGQGGFGAVWGSKNLKAICVIGTGSIAAPAPSSATAVTVAPSTGCPSPSKVSLTVIVLDDPDGVADTTARTPSSPWAPAIGAMAATPTPTTSRTARIAATMRTSGFCIPRSCPGRCDGTEHPGRTPDRRAGAIRRSGPGTSCSPVRPRPRRSARRSSRRV